MYACVCVCVFFFFNIIININVLVWGGNIRGKNGQRTKEKQTQANSSAAFNADALGSVTLASLRGNKHVQKLGR